MATTTWKTFKSYWYVFSMDVEGDYQPSDAEGFIKIQALRLRENKRLQKLLN